MIHNIYNIILFLLLIVFLFASSCGSLVSDGLNYPFIRNITLFVILSFVYFKYKYLPFCLVSIVDCLWFLFTFFVVFALLINNQEKIIEGLKLFLVPIVYFNVLQIHKNFLNIITLSSVFSGLLILFYSLKENEILPDIYYSGIFKNPNTFGASMAVFTIASLCSFLLFKDKHKFYKYCFILLSFIGFYFESLSYCRTGLLVCCLVLFIVIYFLFRTISDVTLRNILIFMFIFALVITIRTYFSEISEYVVLHVYKWSYDDGIVSSSDRIEKWDTVLKHITLFGNNADMLPHNQFLGVIYYYGILAGIVFLLIHLLSLYKCIFSFIKTQKIDSLIATIWVLTLCVISMLEESLGITGREWLILGYVSIGYIDKHLTWKQYDKCNKK